MELSFAARKEMQDVGARFAAARFPNIWQWTFGVREDVADELARLGLISRAEDSASYHLNELGRSWARDDRGLVVAFCPKCSADEHLAKGEPRARARSATSAASDGSKTRRWSRSSRDIDEQG
jgi:hypothetical protein